MTDRVVIDVDGHVFEPDELWVKYLPSKFHDRRPTLERDDRGTTRYRIEGRITTPGTGRGAWVPEGMVESAALREGAWDPQLRLDDMDLEGIDIAVLYGVVGLGLHSSVQDRELANACGRAYNDWLADYCADDPRRLKGTPSLPLRWIDDACKEAERTVRDYGFASITMPCALGDINIDEPHFFPLYELAESLNVPIGFHAGGGRFAHSKFVDSYAQLHALEFPFNLMFATTKFVCGGIMERFPTIRVTMLEAGAGWVPYTFERLDEHWERRPHEMPNCPKAPSEYLKGGRFFVSTEGEDGLPQIMQLAGNHWIVWASDYPHWDCHYPNSVTHLDKRDDITAEDKRVIFHTNAERMLAWH